MGVISLVAMFKLNAFQRDLLVGLAKTGKTSGSDLRTYLRDATDHDEITHNRLYPNLNQLVTDGFVEKGAIDQRTNSYELSEKGEKARKEHTEWVGNSMSLKTHPSKTLEIQIRQAAQENDQTVSQWLVEASRQKLQLENTE